ncbi:MAG: hypothetical protein IPJ93_13770 [Bacteroidota bacterium]|nr:MAG: hypothetical protein IPJ93_13770 [Bacteroidota bacterium]
MGTEIQNDYVKEATKNIQEVETEIFNKKKKATVLKKIHSCKPLQFIAWNQNLQESIFFCHLRRISKYFFQRFKKIKTPDTQALTMQTADTDRQTTGRLKQKHMPITRACQKRG